MSVVDTWTTEEVDEFFTHILLVVGPPKVGAEGAVHIDLYWKAAESHSGGSWPSYSDYLDWYKSLSSRA